MASKKPFRERTFRGAKIEDTINYFRGIKEDCDTRAKENIGEMRVFYEAKANTYNEMIFKLITEYQYRESE